MCIPHMPHQGWGLKRDVLFSFDLQLPADFTPTAADGEMAGFRCTPIEEVCRILDVLVDYSSASCIYYG